MRPSPSIDSFNHLLGAVSKMKHYAFVDAMCKQMLGCTEFQPDVFSMNIWLRCLFNLKKVDLGFSVFAMTIKLGLQPDPYTMNALFLGLIDEGIIVEAMRLFWKLLAKCYPYDQCTYGIIIKGLRRSGNFRFALVLLIK
ncbi:RNA processing factor 1 [Hibiscus trionum]|uniref:RNA processing factor 1 n=1 Tax=Hibiscus trionum TaxID=183268 RepID=A0A9W7J243_HIBTR|nr:RNA processing factor 1 [Hibiscus trionum]